MNDIGRVLIFIESNLPQAEVSRRIVTHSKKAIDRSYERMPPKGKVNTGGKVNAGGLKFGVD